MPSQLTWLDAGLGMLADTPLPPNEKTSSILLVTSYVRGVAQLESELEAGRAARGRPTRRSSARSSTRSPCW